MNIDSVRAITKVRGINQSELAQMTGISRQAVSRWFKAPTGSELNVRTPHLKHLAEVLNLSAEELLRPLPLLNDIEATQRYETILLWDHLYPSVLDFSVAVVRGKLDALARLVQVFGIYQAAKIAGKKIWDRFPEYQKYIRPIRREQIKRVWQLHQNLKSK